MPELIVSAAAFTVLDAVETRESGAQAINVNAPGLLAEETKKIGAGLCVRRLEKSAL